MESRLSRLTGALGSVEAPPLGGVLDGLDGLRRLGLRLLGPGFSRAVLTDREKRVCLLGVTLIAFAFAFATTLPLVALLVGPLVWGIPHILSDVRYLVARPGLHRRPLVLLAIGFGVVAAGLGFGVRGGLAGAAIALCVAKTSLLRRMVGLLVVGSLFSLAVYAGSRNSDLAFAHLHNLVAVILWWAWRPRTGRLHWFPIGLFAICSGLIVTGFADPLLQLLGGTEARWTGLGMRYLCWTLAPDPNAPVAQRLVILFAFAQAVHYVVWLRLVPEEDRPSKTPRSYRQTFHALSKDVGGLILWACVLGALGLIGWAFVGPAQARDGYLRLAFFHGHLELAAGALLWAERQKPS